MTLAHPRKSTCVFIHMDNKMLIFSSKVVIGFHYVHNSYKTISCKNTSTPVLSLSAYYRSSCCNGVGVFHWAFNFYLTVKRKYCFYSAFFFFTPLHLSNYSYKLFLLLQFFITVLVSKYYVRFVINCRIELSFVYEENSLFYIKKT